MDTRTARSNKAKGASFETALVGWFRGLGFTAERLSRRGKQDEGDVSVRGGATGPTFIIEAKNVKTITLADFISQSQVESQRYAEARNLQESEVVPVVVVKRRGKGVDESYAVLTLSTLTRLIERT